MISGDIIMGAEFLGGAVSNEMSAAAAWFGDDGSGGDGCGNDGCGNDGGGDGTGGDGGSGQGGGNTCWCSGPNISDPTGGKRVHHKCAKAPRSY